MTEEQIKQNADEHARRVASSRMLEKRAAYIGAYNSFVAGAHSVNAEVAELKAMLNRAVAELKNVYEDGDYFCEKLLDIPEEEKICAVNCDKDGVQCDCILRYLKHYKKEQ